MVPLLEGLDGSDKMSKTSDNFIALTEKTDEMYSKVMSTPDMLLWRYFELATRVPLAEIEDLKTQVKKGANPRDAKMRLAREIVTLYYDGKRARTSEERFIAVFQKKERPNEIPEIFLKKKEWNILDLMVVAKLSASKGEARRVIEQRGVSIDDEIVSDIKLEVTIPKTGFILKKGKRHFVKILAEVSSIGR